jgi:hypothetical protein
MPVRETSFHKSSLVDSRTIDEDELRTVQPDSFDTVPSKRLPSFRLTYRRPKNKPWPGQSNDERKDAACR